MSEQGSNFVLVRLTVDIAVPQEAREFLNAHRVDHTDTDAVRDAVVDEVRSWWEGLDCPINIEGQRAERIWAAKPWWVAVMADAP
jgi:pyrroloquinoline quinone (PQQ) biosynthesis protein C